MRKLKTHFEQVPIQVVAKLLQKGRVKLLAGKAERCRPDLPERVQSEDQAKAAKGRWRKMDKDDLTNQSSTRWQILCEQAAKEQNSDRLMALVREIIKEFDQRHKEQTKGGTA